MVKKSKPLSKRKTEGSTKEEERGKRHEAVRRALIISEEQKQEMEKEIPNMKVITPSTIAQKFGIRVSIAKAVLNELVERKLIRKIITGGKLKLYTKTSA